MEPRKITVVAVVMVRPNITARNQIKQQCGDPHGAHIVDPNFTSQVILSTAGCHNGDAAKQKKRRGDLVRDVADAPGIGTDQFKWKYGESRPGTRHGEGSWWQPNISQCFLRSAQSRRWGFGRSAWNIRRRNDLDG